MAGWQTVALAFHFLLRNSFLFSFVFRFVFYQFDVHKCWRSRNVLYVRWHHNNDFSSTFNVSSISIPLLSGIIIFALLCLFTSTTCTHSHTNGPILCRRQYSINTHTLRSIHTHTMRHAKWMRVSVKAASSTHSCEPNRLKCILSGFSSVVCARWIRWIYRRCVLPNLISSVFAVVTAQPNTDAYGWPLYIVCSMASAGSLTTSTVDGDWDIDK